MKKYIFNFVKIYIIHEMLILLKNNLNYRNSIFECFFKEYNRQHITMESLSLKEENIIKDIRDLFRLEKENKQVQIEH